MLVAVKNYALAGLFCAALLAASLGGEIAPARGAGDEAAAFGEVNLDPLRQFLPRSDIFMQVPGGVVAVRDDSRPGSSVEERAHHRHGGFVIGYCLRASCARVTHLAVLQVCNNRIGGTNGADTLILGVIKLPLGDTPGQLMSLQGRNYVQNFALYGPYREVLVDKTGSDDTALHRVWAEGMGPVAPLQYLGLAVKPQQSRETIALQVMVARFERSGQPLPRLEVRHFCDQPIS